MACSAPEPESAAQIAGPDWQEALLGWSRAVAPREACGLLLGVRRGADVAIAAATSARNLAPGSGAFLVDPGDFVAAYDAAAARGWNVVGIWHSHLAAPPVPSAADRANAWPDLLHVLVGPVAQEPVLRAWRFDGGRVVAVALSEGCAIATPAAHGT